MVGVFGGLALFVLTLGIGMAWYGEYRVEQDMASVSGSFMANAVFGHLEQRTVDGRPVFVAGAPSDHAWWDAFRARLKGMLRAGGVHALDADGVVVNADQPSEDGMRIRSLATWSRVLAGHATQYIQPADPRDVDVKGTVFGVVVPVTFVSASGGVVGSGAVAVETSAAPLLAGARRLRDLILFATAIALVVVLGSFWLLTRRLAARSFRDPLTNLPNRRHFLEAAELVLAHSARHDRPSALLLADLNRFEEVNDSLGHGAGDAVLRSFAAALAKTSRAGDHVARIGGDDFALLLNEASEEQARLVAERIGTTLESPAALGDRRLRLTASIGIAMFPEDAASIEELLRCADAAMHQAKRSKVPFATFAPESVRATSERLVLESDLRDALLNEDIMVHFQPIVDSGSGMLVAYEALARWSHAAGPISPGTFVPVAERSGLIRKLDRYVFERAVRALAGLLDSTPHAHFSVNLSAQTFADPTLPAYVRDVAERHGVPARRLILEITERAAVESLSRAVSTVHALRDLGFRIALDDFGTGYSSLAYLRRLPIDTVKIDRQFIGGIGKQDSDEELVRAIISYARSLHIQTLAEGVETTEQHAWLHRQGVDFEQGYLHGKPGPLPIAAAE